MTSDDLEKRIKYDCENAKPITDYVTAVQVCFYERARTEDIPFLLDQLQKYKRAVDVAVRELNITHDGLLEASVRLQNLHTLLSRQLEAQAGDARDALTEIDKILGEEK